MTKHFFLLLWLWPSLIFASSLFTRWTVDLKGKDPTAIERLKEEALVGVTLDQTKFFIATSRGTLEQRFVQTGEISWSIHLEAPSQMSWVLAENELFGADTKGFFYSIQAKNGAIQWKKQTKGLFFTKPLITHSQVFALSSQGILYAYDRKTGELLWQQADPENMQTSVWSFQGPVLFQNWIVAGFPSSVLQAFQPQTGQKKWLESFKLIAGQMNDLKSVAMTSNYLLAASFGGDLRVWMAEPPSKKLVWQKKIAVTAPMTVTLEGEVFLSTKDGTLQVLELKTGYLLWQHSLSHGLGTQPAVTKDLIWVGTSGGAIYVFSRQGKLLAEMHNIQSSIWNPLTIISDNEALALSAKGVLRKLHFVNKSVLPSTFRR